MSRRAETGGRSRRRNGSADGRPARDRIGEELSGEGFKIKDFLLIPVLIPLLTVWYLYIALTRHFWQSATVVAIAGLAVLVAAGAGVDPSAISPPNHTATAVGPPAVTDAPTPANSNHTEPPETARPDTTTPRGQAHTKTPFEYDKATATPLSNPNPTSKRFQHELERAIHEEVNEFRIENARSRLAFDEELADIAATHSTRMGGVGHIYHTGPDGSLQDRYRRAGYDCRVPVSESRYATGGENVAKTYYLTRVSTGVGTTVYNSIDEVARGVVEQWATSPGHRDNMLKEYWQREGIGVEVIVEDGDYAVYVTQNFC